MWKNMKPGKTNCQFLYLLPYIHQHLLTFTIRFLLSVSSIPACPFQLLLESCWSVFHMYIKKPEWPFLHVFVISFLDFTWCFFPFYTCCRDWTIFSVLKWVPFAWNKLVTYWTVCYLGGHWKDSLVCNSPFCHSAFNAQSN